MYISKDSTGDGISFLFGVSKAWSSSSATDPKSFTAAFLKRFHKMDAILATFLTIILRTLQNIEEDLNPVTMAFVLSLRIAYAVILTTLIRPDRMMWSK